jgi:hypothetical protein
MRKAFIYLALLLMGAVISSCAGKEAKDTRPVRSFLQPLQERDSVLIADQLLYGFEHDGVTEGTKLIPAEIADSLDQNILSLSPWHKARQAQYCPSSIPQISSCAYPGSSTVLCWYKRAKAGMFFRINWFWKQTREPFFICRRAGNIM